MDHSLLIEQVKSLDVARKEIEDTRKQLNELKPRLSTIARQTLCRDLVEQLEICAKEISELRSMLESDRKIRQRSQNDNLATWAARCLSQR